MQLQGEAVRVTIYVGERDSHEGKSLAMALLHFLKQEGASGATITRGLAGFGARSRIHTANIITLSDDLPLRIEWVDNPQRVDRLLPQVRKMVNSGMIMREDVTVVQYAPGRQEDVLNQPVKNVMRKTAVSVLQDTPLADAVSLLLEQQFRSLAVVDLDGRLQGILTDGDLLKRAGLMTRLGLVSNLEADQVQTQLEALRQQAETAADVMSRQVISVSEKDSLWRAMHKMVDNNLKRLPVVNKEKRLIGWISRLDVLRVLEYHQPVERDRVEPLGKGESVAELMFRDVPTVSPEASLEMILQALEKNRRRRAVVIDENEQVLGIITDGDLVRRSQPDVRTGLLARLRGVMTGQSSTVQLPEGSQTAVSFMSTPVVTITTDTSLPTALQLMMQHAIKRLPVVDEEGRLVGLLGRSSLLRGLLTAKA